MTTMPKWYKAASLVVAAALALNNHWVDACTMIAVGKNATVDGSTMIAHTDDAGGGTSDLRLVRVPAMEFAENATRPVYLAGNGYPRLVANERGPEYLPKPHANQQVFAPLGEIPQVRKTFAYFDQDYAMINEVQLSIAESTCGARTVGWPLTESYGFNLFSIEELTKVALERCETARCAIQTMGDLAVQHGFFNLDSGSPEKPNYADSAEALGISDRFGEVWTFHVLTGANNASAVWAAQRVPDDQLAVIANGFVIRQMNLSDSDNFMASSNVESFAKEQGWWNPEEGPFDFTAAYAADFPGPLMPLYVGRRQWRIYDVFAPSLKLDAKLGWHPAVKTYPFAVVPDQKLVVEDVMSILRDHYEGTEFDMTLGTAAGPFGSPVRYDGGKGPHGGGWERAISLHRTVFSFVLQTNPTLPNYLGGIAWYGQGSPHGTVYVPFSCGQEEIPKSFVVGKQSEFDMNSAWWAFDFVNNWSLLRYNLISVDVKAQIERLQTQAITSMQQLIPRALQLDAALQNQSNDSSATSDSKPMTGLALISRETNAFAEQVVADWWRLAWQLVAKYTDGYITTGETGNDMKAPGYPQWWLEITKFDAWPSDTYDPPQVSKSSSSGSQSESTTTPALRFPLGQDASSASQSFTLQLSHGGASSELETFLEGFFRVGGYVLFGVVFGMMISSLSLRHQGYQRLV